MTPELVEQEREQNLKHSGLGIASFIASLVGSLALFALFIIAGILQATTPGGLDEKSPIAVIIGLLLFAFIGVELVAIGLGIAGYFQKNRKVLFAILGSIFGAVGVFITFALITIGLMGGN